MVYCLPPPADSAYDEKNTSKATAVPSCPLPIRHFIKGVVSLWDIFPLLYNTIQFSLFFSFPTANHESFIDMIKWKKKRKPTHSCVLPHPKRQWQQCRSCSSISIHVPTLRCDPLAGAVMKKRIQALIWPWSFAYTQKRTKESEREE